MDRIILSPIFDCNTATVGDYLHFAYYNFCRIHKTLWVTPAMESKLTDHVWDLSELLA